MNTKGLVKTSTVRFTNHLGVELYLLLALFEEEDGKREWVAAKRFVSGNPVFLHPMDMVFSTWQSFATSLLAKTSFVYVSRGTQPVLNTASGEKVHPYRKVINSYELANILSSGMESVESFETFASAYGYTLMLDYKNRKGKIASKRALTTDMLFDLIEKYSTIPYQVENIRFSHTYMKNVDPFSMGRVFMEVDSPYFVECDGKYMTGTKNFSENRNISQKFISEDEALTYALEFSEGGFELKKGSGRYLVERIFENSKGGKFTDGTMNIEDSKPFPIGCHYKE